MFNTARIVVIVCLLHLGATLNAAVNYRYTGNNFTTYSGVDSNTIETFISASLTLADPLGANFHGDVTPLNFWINDGTLTLNDQSPNLDAIGTFFEFDTDSSGRLTGWDVAVAQNTLTGFQWLYTNAPSSDSSFNCGVGSLEISQCKSALGSAFVGYFGSLSYLAPSSGWTVETVVPEPSSVVLGFIGVLTLVVCKNLRSPAR